MKPIALGDGTHSADLNVSASRSGEVHAWLVDLGRARRCAKSILSRSEQDRATRYSRAEDGDRFGQARSALRLVLARYLDTSPADLRFRSDSRGRPRLAGPQVQAGLDFSVARTADVALVTVSRSPAGADVERVESRPGLRDLATSLYAEAEISCIAAGCGGSWLHGFYRHWTAREAYLKATGEGLTGVRSVQVACSPTGGMLLQGRPTADWVVSTIDVSPRHAATVVAASPVSRCRWLEP